MKIMKSYRLDDTELGMIDYIKKNTKLDTDTAVIINAIISLYLDVITKKEEIKYLLKDEDLLDK